MCTNLSLNPWMNSNLFNLWSFWGIIGDHSYEQIFEFFSEVINWSSSWMSFPESIVFFIFQKFVIRIVWNSFLERWISSIHNEQNNTWGEYIALGSIVIFGWNLRSHISLSSELGMENTSSVFSFQEAWESEISQLKNELMRQENIFRFNISMSVALGMHIV